MMMMRVCHREQNADRERCSQLYDRRGAVHAEFSQMQQLEQSYTSDRKTNSTYACVCWHSAQENRNKIFSYVMSVQNVFEGACYVGNQSVMTASVGPVLLLNVVIHFWHQLT